MNPEALTQAFVSAVENGLRNAAPFCHVVLSRLVPDDVYRTMLELLPPTSLYHELRHKDAIQPDGSSARREFTFTAREMKPLTPEQRSFWSAVSQSLRSPELENAFREALRPGLERRFKEKWREAKVVPKPVLIRDLKGYRIGIHRDIRKKAMTVQFYLPADESQRGLGTAFFERVPDKSFEQVKKMNFMPNTGYAFAVNDHSWHGLEEVAEQAGERNSLMLIYYLAE